MSHQGPTGSPQENHFISTLQRESNKETSLGVPNPEENVEHGAPWGEVWAENKRLLLKLLSCPGAHIYCNVCAPF